MGGIWISFSSLLLCRCVGGVAWAACRLIWERLRKRGPCRWSGRPASSLWLLINHSALFSHYTAQALISSLSLSWTGLIWTSADTLKPFTVTSRFDSVYWWQFCSLHFRSGIWLINFPKLSRTIKISTITFMTDSQSFTVLSDERLKLKRQVQVQVTVLLL